MNPESTQNTERGAGALSRVGSALNQDRRHLIRLSLFGGAAFILGKVFGPSIPLFGGNEVVGLKDFKNFRVVETKKEIGVFNHSGDEIVVIEKE